MHFELRGTYVIPLDTAMGSGVILWAGGREWGHIVGWTGVGSYCGLDGSGVILWAGGREWGHIVGWRTGVGSYCGLEGSGVILWAERGCASCTILFTPFTPLHPADSSQIVFRSL